MPNSPAKTREDGDFFPGFSPPGIRTLVLYFVALNAVAIGRERRASHAVAGRAGGRIRLGHAMQGFGVVDGRPRLRKDFGMANGAIALDPLVVQLMSERALAVLVF